MGGYHLIVLAKNSKGYHNLVKLVSRAWVDGFYMRPRTDHEDLEKYHEGLIVCSACIAGEVPHKILENDIEGARQSIEWHKRIFGDDYYLELQRHEVTDPNVRANRETYPLQQKANKILVELAREYGVKLVCTNDCHFVDKDNAEAHDHLLCLATGKDLDDYRIGNSTVPYHLIDICEPGEKYNLFRYQSDFHKVYEAIVNRGHIPILCGGSGLYIEAVLKGYSLSPVPQNDKLRDSLAGKSLEELTRILVGLKEKTGSKMHNRSDVDTPQRAIRAIEIERYNIDNPMPERELPSIDSLLIGVSVDREERRRRISERLRARIEEGMVDEVRHLIDSGVSAESLIYYGLEYKYVTEYVTGKISYEEMYSRLEIAIHQFAKRQMTWFRGMERRGFHIHWIDASRPTDELVDEILEIKKQNDLNNYGREK